MKEHEFEIRNMTGEKSIIADYVSLSVEEVQRVGDREGLRIKQLLSGAESQNYAK